MKKILQSFILLTWLFAGYGAVAQGTVVSGKVTDATGSALPGANVLLKNSTQGVPTDVEGKYTITVPSPKSVLVFTMIGMANQ